MIFEIHHFHHEGYVAILKQLEKTQSDSAGWSLCQFYIKV